jgi:hypothetical protein
MEPFSVYLVVLIFFFIIRNMKLSSALEEAFRLGDTFIDKNQKLEVKLKFIVDECGQKAVEASERWDRLNTTKE